MDEIDVAFRVGPLADSSLVARKLGPAQMVLCASPAYADENGLPQKPADLYQHVLIKHPVAHLELEGPNGIEYIDSPARMVANDMVFIKNMVKRGLGIGGVPLAIAEDELRSGDLVPVLTQFPFVLREFYLVYPSRRQLPSKVVAFIDFIMEHCLERLPWNKDFSELIN